MMTSRSSRFLFGLVGCCLELLFAACSSTAGTSTTVPPTATRLAQGTTLVTYRGHTGRVVSLQWSPDGKRILSGSLDGTTQVWEAASGKHLVTYPTGGASFSPDGTRLATPAGNAVQVLEAASGHVLLTYIGHSDTVWKLAWSPDGTRLASGSDDRTVRVWDAATGQTRLIFRGHTDGVREVAWSPDGTRLASASLDRTVQVFDAATGQLLVSYRGHANPVWTVAWSPDGTRLASGEAEPFQTWPETTMRIWDATTGRTLFTYQSERHYERVWHVAWSPDGKHLAAALDDGKVAILDASTYQTVFTYREHQEQVDALAWSPDGTRLASGGGDGFVKVWQATA